MDGEWQFDLQMIKAFRDRAEELGGQRLTLEAVESVLLAAMTNTTDWKFVPTMPTEQMRKAADHLTTTDDWSIIYPTMIANSPDWDIP